VRWSGATHSSSLSASTASSSSSRDALRFPEEDKDALRSLICIHSFPLRCERDPAVELGHGEFLSSNLVALRSSAFPDCSSDARHTLVQVLRVLKSLDPGFVPDDKLVLARYQPVLRVRPLIPLYSGLYATEFATITGVAPEGLGGGLDGRTSDSASESYRKRLKTESASSREHDSWSNNASPECDGRVSPDAKSVEQHPSPSSECPASDGAKKAFVYLLLISSRCTPTCAPF
jgi:hypothetical protein